MQYFALNFKPQELNARSGTLFVAKQYAEQMTPRRGRCRCTHNFRYRLLNYSIEMVARAGGPYLSLQALREDEVTPSELGSKAAGVCAKCLLQCIVCACVLLVARPAYICENWLGVESHHTWMYSNAYIYIYMYKYIYIYISVHR